MSETNTGWRGSEEISEELAGWPPETLEKLVDIRHLAAILRGCLFVESVETYAPLVASVAPSSHAKAIIALDPALSSSNDTIIRIACLLSIYHHELMFDLATIDEKEIEREIGNLLKSGKLIVPHRFGRVLYDRYAEQFPATRKLSLNSEESLRLIAGTEQGVAQSRKFLAGPLGLIHSLEPRTAPPSTYVPLWHCADVGCNHLHDVDLKDENATLHDMIVRVDYLAQMYFGPHSDWGSAISKDEQSEYGENYGDLFAVIHESFSDQEAQDILIDLLQASSNKSAVWDAVRSSSLAKGGPADPNIFVKSMARHVVNQLILISEDSNIISSIDKLISKRAIKIPAAEVRKARHKQPSFSGSNSTCSLSMLGIRSDRAGAIAELALEIWRAYDEADRLTDLSWRAARAAGPATPGTVIEYLNDHTPEQAVRDLILGTRDVAIAIAESVRAYDPIDNEDPNSVPRLLWKLGFNIPRYGSELVDVVRHLDAFKQALFSCEDPLASQDRERVRSAGVNLFVELEHFIENVISYNVWLLSSDLFIEKFVYNPVRAVGTVSGVIGPQGVGVWKDEGGNTLGVLLAYLSASAEWMDTLKLEIQTIEKRPEDEYPHYALGKDDIFPFHYRPLWANCDDLELGRFAKNYKDIAALFLRSDAAGVRNGLDHFRHPDDFPSLDAMLACEARLRQAVEVADAKRLFPKRWWMSSRKSNEFGQIWEVYTDQRKQSMELRYPTVLTGIAEFYYGQAVVAPHGNLLGQANASILLRVMEPSDYERLWQNYPARPVGEEAPVLLGGGPEIIDEASDPRHTLSEISDLGDA